MNLEQDAKIHYPYSSIPINNGIDQKTNILFQMVDQNGIGKSDPSPYISPIPGEITSPQGLAASSPQFGVRLAAVSLPTSVDKAMRRPCNMQQHLGFAKPQERMENCMKIHAVQLFFKKK